MTHSIYFIFFITGEFLDAISSFPFAESVGDTRNHRELRETHKLDMQFKGKVFFINFFYKKIFLKK